MLYYLLFNPRANAGNTISTVVKLAKKLEKKKNTCQLVNLLVEEDIIEAKKKLKYDDIIVIIGGDGTLHHIINHKLFSDITNKIYLYKAGRGNDFSRGHKGKFFEITKELKNLPHVVTNGNLKSNFVNGIGVGIDAYTCKAQIDNADRGIKESYFKIAFKAFKNFKPFSIDVIIDGNSYHYDKVWFFVVQNGKYFGGGMKISPYSIRLDDKLEFYVIHNIGYRRLLAIFPLIFLGKHIWAKKYVKSVAGKNFSIKVNGYDVMQKDGEVEAGVNSLVVNRY